MLPLKCTGVSLMVAAGRSRFEEPMKTRIYEFKACILIMFWLRVFSITAFAQAAPGALCGQVTDPSGAVINQANVTATSSAGQKAAVTTDARGNYEFKGLSPVLYS